LVPGRRLGFPRRAWVERRNAVTMSWWCMLLAIVCMWDVDDSSWRRLAGVSKRRRREMEYVRKVETRWRRNKGR
jgi:hypothetical protein